MGNRNGFAVAGVVTHASGPGRTTPAGAPAQGQEQRGGPHHHVGGDKAYDTSDHVAALRAIGVTPHVALNRAVTKTVRQRKSVIGGRTTRHQGYGMSQSHRAAIECIFGYGKQRGTLRKIKHRWITGVAADFLLNLIAYNLMRISKPIAA